MAHQSGFQVYSQWVAGGKVGAMPRAAREFLGAQTDKRIAQEKAAGYGPANFNYLLDPLNKEVADTVKNANRHASNKNATSDRSKIAKAAAEGKTLYSATPSTCFSEVSWTDGVATLSFANKTQMTIDIPMALDEWLEFCTGSMGENFNAGYYGEGV